MIEIGMNKYRLLNIRVLLNLIVESKSNRILFERKVEKKAKRHFENLNEFRRLKKRVEGVFQEGRPVCHRVSPFGMLTK